MSSEVSYGVPAKATAAATTPASEGLKPAQLSASKGLSPSTIVASFDQPQGQSSAASFSSAPAVSGAGDSSDNDLISMLGVDFNDANSLDALLTSFPNTCGATNSGQPASVAALAQGLPDFSPVSGGLFSSAPTASSAPFAVSGDFLSGLSAGLSPLPSSSAQSSSNAAAATSSSLAAVAAGIAAHDGDDLRLDDFLSLDPSLSGLAPPVPIGAVQSPLLSGALSPSSQLHQQGQPNATSAEDLDLDSLLASFGS